MSDGSKRPITLSWVATGIGLALLILGVLLSKTARGSVMVPAYLAAGVVAILGLLSMFRALLARRQALEEEDVAEYRRTHGDTELFEDADEAVRLATRANEHFLKYFVPFFTMALGLATVLTCMLLWRHWGSMDVFPVARRPLPMAALSIVLALFAAISGSYFLGVSREPGCRWLRPSGAWMFLSGGLFVLSAAVMLCENFHKWVDVVDYRMAQVGVVILMALGIEQLLSFVIEFYRPRMPGEEIRPLPESRILALFTEPGGIARNVAASLDYQFGFEVSEVWFYRFLERTLVPFAVITLIFLWLLTCIVTLQPQENGIREHFGAVHLNAEGRAEILQPGLHFKWPWPFAKIKIFPVAQVQELTIGAADEPSTPGKDDKPDDENQPEIRSDVILWSQAHHKDEQNFVVANKARASALVGGSRAVSVSFLAASIPVYFRVRDFYAYEYKHANARETLDLLATRELIRYLAGVDFETVLGPGRAEAGRVLAKRIDTAARKHDLGVDIVFVGLQALHPPVAVGAAFDAVVGASEIMHKNVLEAEAKAIMKTTKAEGERVHAISVAEAYREERGMVSSAEAGRFRKQLLAYEKSPQLFVLNSFLDVLETEGSKVRKYVIGTPTSKEVFVLDLVEKLGKNLLDLDLGSDEEKQDNTEK